MKSSRLGRGRSAQRAKFGGPAQSGEFERIARIRSLFSVHASRQVKVGIGDDAAILSGIRGDLVWTVDSCVQDVHFRFGWLSEKDVGWRSFQAAASDLAAMGASPVAALSALELPRSYEDRAVVGLLQGQKDAATMLGCPMVGGNLSSAKVVSITTTVLGQTKEALLRSGACVGDELWLVGEVGLAAAGLHWLMVGAPVRRGSATECCVTAWRRPEALIGRGRALLGRAHSAIDISDGLVGDAQHIAESSHVAIELDVDALGQLLRPELRQVAQSLSRSAIDLALFGGEDYALLATGPRSRRPRWANPIGRVVAGRGVWGITRATGRQRLRRGFDHFEQ
jgi:thiamine-monophosphate kinase